MEQEIKVGDMFLTKQGYWIAITEVVKKHTNYTITFENGFELREQLATSIRNGGTRYPFHPTVHGVGFLGVGKYLATNRVDERNKPYTVWQAMLGRCYCPIVQKRQPNTKNYSVDSKWHNYQNFAKWFEDNYIEGFEISNNILQPDSTVFSADTCCFIPTSIKNLIKMKQVRLGKETRIKMFANKWQHKLPKKTYKALMNYKIN